MHNRLIAICLGLAAATLALPAWAAPTELRIGVALEPPILDPTAGSAEAIDIVVYQNIFEGLTRIDRTGAVQPGLATAWTNSDDGLTYTFALAEGVTFHDGTAFDADDVVFSFERIPTGNNAQKDLYADIQSVRAIDPATVEITLRKPSGRFLFDIGRGDAVIVAPESAEDNATTPIGTGPFAFVNWRRGSEVTLERNEAYWGPKPALTRVNFVFISDAAAMTNALLAGSIDGTNNFSTQTVQVFQNNPRFKVLVGTTEGETILATNTARPPFTDLRVRQAMAHALNRAEIIQGASNGFGTPIGSHFSPLDPYYVDLTGTYPYDPDTARALLAEAGFPDGFSATLKLPPVGYARNSGQIIASQFAEVGIRLEQVNVEFQQWLGDVFSRKDFDLTIISHVEPFDIGIYANPDYYFGYDDPEFQATIAKLNETTNDDERKALAIAAQTRLAQQAVNGYLFELAQVGVWNARIEGQWVDSPIEGVVLRDIHWVD